MGENVQNKLHASLCRRNMVVAFRPSVFYRGDMIFGRAVAGRTPKRQFVLPASRLKRCSDEAIMANSRVGEMTSEGESTRLHEAVTLRDRPDASTSR